MSLCLDTLAHHFDVGGRKLLATDAEGREELLAMTRS